MPDRDILFQRLDNDQDLYFLKDHLRELYRLLDKRFITVDYAASVSYNSDIGDVFLTTLTGNITTIILSNAYKGRILVLVFKQDSTGSRGISGWPANTKLAGASFTPTATANSYSTLTLIYEDTNWVEVSRTLDVR